MLLCPWDVGLISVIQDDSQNSRHHVHIAGRRKEELINREGEGLIAATFKKRFKEGVTLLFDYPSVILLARAQCQGQWRMRNVIFIQGTKIRLWYYEKRGNIWGNVPQW